MVPYHVTIHTLTFDYAVSLEAFLFKFLMFSRPGLVLQPLYGGLCKKCNRVRGIVANAVTPQFPFSLAVEVDL